MYINIRLLDNDTDLKQLFQEIEHSNKTINEIVSSSLNSQILKQDSIFGHIKVGDCSHLKNRDVLVNITNPEHLKYIETNRTEMSSSSILKAAIRRVYVFQHDTANIEEPSSKQASTTIETSTEEEVCVKFIDTPHTYTFKQTDGLMTKPFLNVLRSLRQKLDISNLTVFEVMQNLLNNINSEDLENIRPKEPLHKVSDLENLLEKGLFVDDIHSVDEQCIENTTFENEVSEYVSLEEDNHEDTVTEIQCKSNNTDEPSLPHNTATNCTIEVNTLFDCFILSKNK